MSIIAVSHEQALELAHPILWDGNVVGAARETTPQAMSIRPWGVPGRMLTRAIAQDLAHQQTIPGNFTPIATYEASATSSEPFDAVNHEPLTYLGVDHEFLAVDADNPLSEANFEGVTRTTRHIGEQAVGSWITFASERILYSHQYSLGRIAILPQGWRKSTLSVARTEVGIDEKGRPIPTVVFGPGKVVLGQVQRMTHALLRINRIDILQRTPPKKR